jgi:prophage regulatory protein
MQSEAADIQSVERRIAEGQRRLIRLPEVLRTVGCSRSQWYHLISLKRAPSPVPLGERMRAWDEREVQAFISERIAARDAGKQPA